MTTVEDAAKTTSIRSVRRYRRWAFFSDLAAVSSRALRATRRDIESLLPALIIPVFFFVINIGALQDVAENIPGLDYKAFQLPVAIIFAVTGVSRAITLVFDIQSGYFDRLSLTPVNRVSLLLGLMVADFALCVALSIPVLILGFVVGVRFESGLIGILAFVLIAGDMEPRLRRIPLRHSPQDRQPHRRQHQLAALLPVRLPDHGLPPAGGPHRLDEHNGHLQPRHLPPRRAPLPRHRRLGHRGTRPRLRRHRRSSRHKPNPRLPLPTRPRPPQLINYPSQKKTRSP